VATPPWTIPGQEVKVHLNLKTFGLGAPLKQGHILEDLQQDLRGGG
jgi:hypothetical protein